MDPQDFDDTVTNLVDRLARRDLSDDTIMKEITALGKFAELRRVVVTVPEPAPTLAPIPESAWCRVKAGAARIWDNETTRVAIKAGGALTGVIVVAWSTIHKDGVLEKQALAQANTRTV